MKIQPEWSDMQTFTVDRLKLMEALKRNKDKHLEEYQTALIGWKKAVQKRLDKEVKRLKDENESPNLHLLNDLPKPQAYEKDYDQALEALEWEKRDEVELDWTQMNQWARDQWGWSAGTTALLARYSG